MPNPIVAIGGASAASSIIGGNRQARAARDAASSQERAAEAGIAEQRRQFDAIQQLLAPFVSQGTDAVRSMAALSGLSGQNEQVAAIDAVQRSPGFRAALDAGQDAILQNASATGGLRGGNTQAALAEFAPALLGQAIDRQYGQLGGLAQIGQASAAQQASAGQATGTNVANLLQQRGAATAGGQLAAGNAFNNALGGVNQALGFSLSNNMTPPDGATLFSQWGF